jgi:hypothetical protein
MSQKLIFDAFVENRVFILQKGTADKTVLVDFCNRTERREAVDYAMDVTEQKRLNDAREAHIPWKKWGPYLSERQWGTVREDFSDNGNAWDYFSHDQARSRAYRWGEDGLGGLCDDQQRLKG